MDWLKGFDLNRWWNAAIAAGLAITLAALAVDNRSVVLLGLGIVACGLASGSIIRCRWSFMYRGRLTSYHRVNRPLGVTLDALGMALVGLGIYRLIMS